MVDPITLALIVAGAAGASKLHEKYKERKANWRRLKMGMTTSHVRSIVGQPSSIQTAGNTIIWKYVPGGQAVFADDKLMAWKEPTF